MTKQTPVVTHNSQAMRFNEGKLEWHQLDLQCHEDMVRVLMMGAKKYQPDNWRRGLPVRSQYDSLMRHMVAFMQGQDLDSESGLPHLAHAQCNLMFLVHMMANHAEQHDNRKPQHP